MNITHTFIQASAMRGARQVLWDIDADVEPPLGAQLVTPRHGYSHHGIYVGNGRVVHYAGLCESLQAGPVEEVSLERFAANRPVWIEYRPLPGFAAGQVVARARSRLGESRYRLLTNNCEHFCTWCRYGCPRSDQVRGLLVRPLAALGLLWRLLPRLLVRASPQLQRACQASMPIFFRPMG
jgi:hypothetical protein